MLVRHHIDFGDLKYAHVRNVYISYHVTAVKTVRVSRANVANSYALNLLKKIKKLTICLETNLFTSHTQSSSESSVS